MPISEVDWVQAKIDYQKFVEATLAAEECEADTWPSEEVKREWMQQLKNQKPQLVVFLIS